MYRKQIDENIFTVDLNIFFISSLSASIILSYSYAGQVPSLQEGNLKESVFSFPWLKEGPIVLGIFGNWCM